MPNLKLPKTTLSKEQYKALPSLQKEEYIQNILKKILQLNSLGLTISQIVKNTYLSHSVVWHHLEVLAARGECLRIERGDVDVYFYNKVIDSLSKSDFLDNTSDFEFKYNFDLIENNFGKFLRIQRQRESRSDANSTKSGIIVPYKLVGKIADRILKIKESLPK